MQRAQHHGGRTKLTSWCCIPEKQRTHHPPNPPAPALAPAPRAQHRRSHVHTSTRGTPAGIAPRQGWLVAPVGCRSRVLRLLFAPAIFPPPPTTLDSPSNVHGVQSSSWDRSGAPDTKRRCELGQLPFSNMYEQLFISQCVTLRVTATCASVTPRSLHETITRGLNLQCDQI